MTIYTSCQYLYNSLHIPIFIYNKNNILLRCFPKQEKYLHLHNEYTIPFFNSDFNLSFIETKHFSYYGCIKSTNKEYTVIIGPTTPLPYTTEVLAEIHKQYNITSYDTEAFDQFYCSIPIYNIDTFLATILLFNLLINQTDSAKSNIYNISNSPFQPSMDSVLYQNYNMYLQKTEFEYNYEIEKELYHYVETGNIKKLEQFYDSMAYEKYQVSYTSNSYLRQRKNEFIIAITSISRSAIKGGFLASSSYRLAELYIKQMEKLNTAASVDELLIRASFDFTKRTATCIDSRKTTDFIRRIQVFVNTNIYHGLSVKNIAEVMNYNKSYLSHRFKIEFGSDLNQYIYACKIEESRNLLEFTDKSLSEISSLLGFSSQSHFQTKFKQYNNMTPKKYRNHCKRR